MDSGRKPPPRRRVYREQPRRDDYDEFDYELADYDEPRPRRPPPRRPQKKRSIWPVLLMGCGLGILLTVLAAVAVVFFALRSSQGASIPSLPIINNTHPFSRQEQQPLPAITSLTQLRVCDKFGNVSIKVDQTATVPTLTASKTVQATSQTNADQTFQQLAVQAGSQNNAASACPNSTATPAAQPTSGSALFVTVSFPDTGSLVRTNSNTVDLTLSLPPSILQSDGPILSLNVESTIGNIDLDGLSGTLNVREGTGNVSVSHAALADNSHLNTGQGNVTFNGLLILPNGNGTAHYFISSELGQLDVTLPSSTSVTLNANTNVGAINSAFPITMKPTTDGSASYRGPLTPSTGTTETNVLELDVSTGNILIHQLQS